MRNMIRYIIYVVVVMIPFLGYLFLSMHQLKKEDKERKENKERQEDRASTCWGRFRSALILLIMVMLGGPISSVAEDMFFKGLNLLKSVSSEKLLTKSEKESETLADTEEEISSAASLSVSGKRNTVINDESIPVSERVLIPENSLYPTVDMEVVDREGGSAQVKGYQGAWRSQEAVTFPFEKPVSDPDGLFTELEYEILKNPLVADMIAKGLTEECNEFVSDEVWLQDFVSLCDKAYELPYDEEDRGMGYWLTAYKFSDGQTAVYVTDEYRKYAEKLCVFLEGFANYGVQTYDTTTCYARNFGVGYENMRTESLKGDMEEELPALVLCRLDDNGQMECAIGFDLNDKGLLIYDAETF